MFKYERSKCPPVVVAAMTASLLMLVSGSGYRVLAARLAGPVGTEPIAPAKMDQFPSQIGDWTGREVPLDKAIVRATDTDAHLSRAYSRHDGLDSVYLYIACGVKARDLMPHRPEVCYTGNGWTLEVRRSIEVPLSDGSKLPCNLLQFSKGALRAEEVIILDYYIVDGQYCADVSLLRSKAWRGSGTVQYVAQVEVMGTITPTLPANSTAKLVSTFAAESASLIAQLFENRQSNLNSDGSNESSKGE
jgi:EpsI family protein